MKSNVFKIEAWGDFACFSRTFPDRRSYEAPTPSSVRGIFESIFAKPNPKQFRWEPVQASIINPIKYAMLPFNGTKQFNKHDHTQIKMMVLQDVRYILEARMVPLNGFKLTRLAPQFERRLRTGGRFRQPCFGMQEFAAYVKEPDVILQPSPIDLNIGTMLYDVFDPTQTDNTPSPSYFQAKIENGIIKYPEYSKLEAR